MPTITKSVILQPGEQFTLPPGAILLGSDNASNIISSCEQTIPQLNYTSVILAWDVPDVIFDPEIDNRTNWMGVKIGTTYYSFTTPCPWISGALLRDQLNLLAVTVPFINTPTVEFDGDSFDGGERFVVRINILTTYKDEFYAVRTNVVNGNIGTGSSQAVSTAYVRFKEDPNSIL
jgi:hypothetical protein